MKKKIIKKIAVLGSGNMGSGIAALLNNVGYEVVLLDILPPGLDPNIKDSSKRNAIATNAIKKAVQLKPAPFFIAASAQNIILGNLTDDLGILMECDWVIEVIVEDLEIKRKLYERIEQNIRPNTIVSSNTSSIPINLLVEGRSQEFKKNFCGTHFFNPPRYLELLEIIPHQDTDKELIDFLMYFGKAYLGKKTVLCKDTPGFIGNRIGMYSGSLSNDLVDEFEITVEEADAIFGEIINRPSTAHFRLQDLVGIDITYHVGKVLCENCKNDEYFIEKTIKETEPYIEYLLKNKYLGNKSGQGFYRKTDRKDENGKSVYEVLDLNKLVYRDSLKINIPLIKALKKIELIDKKYEYIFQSDDKYAILLQKYITSLLVYTAHRIPEISDNIYSVDDAMKAGYAWGYGPFEYWDIIGTTIIKSKIKEFGLVLPPWVEEMNALGIEKFYSNAQGGNSCYSPIKKQYEAIEGIEDIIILNKITTPPIFKNSEVIIHDIGDGVMCAEFISKGNTIGEDAGNAISTAIDIAQRDGWNGIVIGNNDKNFSLGANLMMVGMLGMQQDFNTLERIVDDFQQLNLKIKYSGIPVVAATSGYVFGGGCELQMHCDATVAAGESYIGLVEVGVGLLPGGGGTKEMALRASKRFFVGDIQIPTLLEHFKPIALASVATSAKEAFVYDLLSPCRDIINNNRSTIIHKAKKIILNKFNNYIPPQKMGIHVLGQSGLAALYAGINEFYLGNYMTDHDVIITRKVAKVMCGGELSSPQKVSEQYLLDLEREEFLSLLGMPKTLERIQYMLINKKPLRN